MAKVKRETPVKKVRKKRKPMTEEQKAAAVERLAKARAARQAANPPEYKNVHPSVLEKDDEDTLSFKNVREWIKYQKEMLSAARQELRSGVKGSEAKVASIQGYLSHMDAYLRSGDWIDSFYGMHREHKMTERCVAMAYNADGTPKRSHGVYYPDLGYVWGKEPESNGLEEFME